MNLNIELPQKIISGLFNNYRYKILYGGRGGAKSWGVARYILIKCLEKRHRVLCTRQFQNSIKDSVHKLLSDQIYLLGLEQVFEIKLDSIVNKLNGSEIIFKGLGRQIAEVKSTEGVSICWVEEAQFVTEESWVILIPTIRVEGSEIIISFNPDSNKDSTYHRFITHKIPNSLITKINYYDNPYFPEILKTDMLYMKETDYDTYLNIWEGEPKSFSDALVFKGKYRIGDFEPYNEKKDEGGLYIGIDWGFSQDPMACTRSFIREREGKKTLYIEYEAYKIGVEVEDIQAFLEENIPNIKNYKIVADCENPQLIFHLKKKGFSRIIGCTKYSKTAGAFREDGIRFMRSFQEIVIHPRCREIIKEFGLYKHKIDKNTGEILSDIIEKYDHGIDAVRYSLETFILKKKSVTAFLA